MTPTNTPLKARETVLGGEKAVSAWDDAMKALHAFARASNCPLGADVITWFADKRNELSHALRDPFQAARAEGRPSPEGEEAELRAAARRVKQRLDAGLAGDNQAEDDDIRALLNVALSPSPEAGREEDLRAEVLAIFKANKMATDERLAILIAERLAPRLSPPAPEPEDLEDAISDALQDSLGPNWTCRDGAKAVMRLLEARRA